MVADSYLASPTPVPPDDEGSSVIYLEEAMRKCDVAMCVVAAGMHSRELRRLRLCDAVPALATAAAARHDENDEGNEPDEAPATAK